MPDSSSSDDEPDTKRHKHEKKKRKHKSDKHGKEHGRHDDDRKGAKKHKKDKHSSKQEPPTTTVSNPISEADYFKRAPEFQLWLAEARRQYIDEISGEEARRLFGKFVVKWNGGELASKFYSGIQADAAASRTRHQWGFASKLSDADQLTLDRTKDAIAKVARQGDDAQRQPMPMPAPRVPSMPPANPPRAPSLPGTSSGGGARAPPGSRLAELQAKEQERMESFKRQMGL